MEVVVRIGPVHCGPRVARAGACLRRSEDIPYVIIGILDGSQGVTDRLVRNGLKVHTTRIDLVVIHGYHAVPVCKSRHLAIYVVLHIRDIHLLRRPSLTRDMLDPAAVVVFVRDRVAIGVQHRE